MSLLSALLILVFNFSSCAKEDLFQIIQDDSVVPDTETGSDTPDQQTPNDDPDIEGINIDYDDMGELKAFPTAVGFGQFATGGRGGKVLKVINLNDSGPGSFREAVESTGPRIIVFEVAGRIELSSNIVISNPDLTIAGQTSNGGIMLTGRSIIPRASNLVIRYISLRVGDGGYKNDLGTIVGRDIEDHDGVSIQNARGVVFDHCSISWSIDENFSFYGSGTADCTLQNSIIAECLLDSHHTEGMHSMGLLVNENIHNISIIGNLLTQSRMRAPRIKPGSSVEFINNVVYDLKQGEISDGTHSVFIGNTYIAGTGTSKTNNQISMNNTGSGGETKIYVEDNRLENSSLDLLSDEIKKFEVGSKPFDSGYEPLSAGEAKENVLSKSGNNLYRDAVDIRLVNDVYNLTGYYIDTQEQVGGFPNIEDFGDYPKDTDNDGMSDAWEVARFGSLSENASDDANDNGYSNIEEYLYFLTILKAV